MANKVVVCGAFSPVVFGYTVDSSNEVMIEYIRKDYPDSPRFVFRVDDQPLNKHQFIQDHLKKKAIIITGAGRPNRGELRVSLTGDALSRYLAIGSKQPEQFRFGEWYLKEALTRVKQKGGYSLTVDPRDFIQKLKPKFDRLHPVQRGNELIKLVMPEDQAFFKVKQGQLKGYAGLEEYFIEYYGKKFKQRGKNFFKCDYKKGDSLEDYVKNKFDYFENHLGLKQSFKPVWANLQHELEEFPAILQHLNGWEVDSKSTILAAAEMFDTSTILQKELPKEVFRSNGQTGDSVFNNLEITDLSINLGPPTDHFPNLSSTNNDDHSRSLPEDGQETEHDSDDHSATPTVTGSNAAELAAGETAAAGSAEQFSEPNEEERGKPNLFLMNFKLTILFLNSFSNTNRILISVLQVLN